MLILIISFIILGIGIGICIAGVIYNRKAVFHHEVIWPYMLGGFLASVGFLSVLAFGAYAIQVSTDKPLEYIHLKDQYDLISYKLETYDTDDEMAFESLSYSIRVYNEKIMTARYYKDNPWIGIYYNDLIAELPLIDYSEIFCASP